VAGELQGFNAEAFIPRKQRRTMTPTSELAVIATEQARCDADLDLSQEDRDRIGVIIGTAGGATIQETEDVTRKLIDGAGKRLSPIQVSKLWPNIVGYHVAEFQRVRGYNATICTACASSTQAIGEAAEIIRRGWAEVMFAGGAESLVSEAVLAGFAAARVLSSGYNDKPSRAVRPFDAGRDGFAPAQGSAMFVLESLPHAQARGARIYAEVLGLGVSNDSTHLTAPDPDGQALAMRRALESAGMGIEDVDYINAHATATVLGDIVETNAIKQVFGAQAYQLPISATKSMIGHMLGAAGAIEALVCIMTIQDGVIHPTINLDSPDPECDLDYVPHQARQAPVDVVLSNSFGFGGQNACLVLGRCEG
jgi:3-oxoacyl-[acyl-carrier-protein] synthase II